MEKLERCWGQEEVLRQAKPISTKKAFGTFIKKEEEIGLAAVLWQGGFLDEKKGFKGSVVMCYEYRVTLCVF